MDIEKLKAFRLKNDGLSKTLGIEFFSTPAPDTVGARLEVNPTNSQPFGFLSQAWGVWHFVPIKFVWASTSAATMCAVCRKEIP